MSRYHMIDAGEGKGYHQDTQGFLSPSSTLSTSPRLDHHSTGRGDPLFPDIDMHLGMIFGMNSVNGTKNFVENSGLQAEERIQMRLKFLEDSNTVMQSRNQNLITENKELSYQIEEEARAMNDLKSQLKETRAELEKERIIRTEESIIKNTTPEFKDQIISTDDLTVPKIEKSAQCWAVCLACQRKLEGNETAEPTVTITKSELESLESDMQALRDAVVTREEAWDRAMEREQNYRQQLSRLSAETVTARHLSDSRNSELEAFTVTLAEKEAELRATQKDLFSLKKIIVKMERRQRDFGESFDIAGNGELNSNLMSEREQKTIEEIICRQNSVKSYKQRSHAAARSKGTSSMPQSLQSSPRSARIKDNNYTAAAPGFSTS